MTSTMAWMLVAALASPIITLFVGVYFMGRVGQQVSDHGDRLGAHDERLDDHAAQINRHEVQIAEQRGFQRGFESREKQ